MKVLIYTDEDQRSGLESITSTLKKTIPNFHWDITCDKNYFKTKLGVFKIVSSNESLGVEDIHWEPPSVFLKNKKKKEVVWQDINDRVVPAMKKEVVSVNTLKLTDEQLQQILSMITDSKTSFVLDHPNGATIGVNTKTNVDISLTTSDIASMLAASWLFKSGGVRFTD